MKTKFMETATISNRWKDTLLNIEKGLACSKIDPQKDSAEWHFIPFDNMNMLIFNKGNGNFLNMEKGLKCSDINTSWHSAQWFFEPADSNFYRIKNRWKKDCYLHIERGKLECGKIKKEWWSAMWIIKFNSESKHGPFVIASSNKS